MGLVAYKVKPRRGGTPALILVESESGASGVPRSAAFVDIEKAASDLGKAVAPITAVAEAFLEALRVVRPGEVLLEFGVELGGKAGLPIITQGEAKANFKIQLTWKSSDSEDRDDGRSEGGKTTPPRRTRAS